MYSTILHLSSLESLDNGFQAESLAFVPQLLLAVIAIPLALAKTDLATTMLAQTFAFVTFNKVCTSQVRWVISHDGAELIVRVVLSMVHGVPAILPATLIPFETACKRPSRTRFLGRWSSFLAAAGVST